jgi:carboxyl-terminal processing protease
MVKVNFSVRNISFFMGCLGLMLCSACQIPHSSKSPASPEEMRHQAEDLYHQAWTMLGEEYVDRNFNGQDWSNWRDRFNGKLNTPEDAYVAIQTMTASLNDEYTRFLRPREMHEQSMSIDSRLYGVGIQISLHGGKLVVLATIDDTPAKKAGLLPNDIITRIDGHETAGFSVEEAADRIRGPKGSSVELTILRGNKILTKRIQRDEIRIHSVFTKALSDKNIGYIRLSSFISEDMLSELDEALAKVDTKKALIIDLRQNYGGLFSNATELADMLLDQGDIVAVVDRDQQKRVRKAHPGVRYSRPVVLLIDGGSASASEILSGALKDNHRATLIGTRSFGKGLVQKINLLPLDSGLNITISKYLTPNGTDIHKKGIEPNYQVPFTEENFKRHEDPQLDAAIRFLHHEKMTLTPLTNTKHPI